MSASVPTPTYYFQLSGFTQKKKLNLSKIIHILGGVVLMSDRIEINVTHIICGKPSRSEKFMCGIALGRWILTHEYVTESCKARRWLHEAPYEWNIQKADQVVGVENALPLLRAVSRWRLHVNNGGAGAFFGWRVAVLVENAARKMIYKRLLQFGGASIVNVDLPIRQAALVARQVSHVFVSDNYIDHVRDLLKIGVMCLMPVYIGIYLMMDPSPEPRQYLVRTANIAAVNAGMPKLQSASRSQQQTDLSDPVHDDKRPVNVPNIKPALLPVVNLTKEADPRCDELPDIDNVAPHVKSARSPATANQDKVSSSTRKGTKRKLEISNTTSKRIKIDLPWATSSAYVIGNYIDQNKKVARQAPVSLTMMYEACLEESRAREALDVLWSCTSAIHYPHPKSLYSAINTLLLMCTTVAMALKTFGVLRRVLSLHPPTTTALQDLYLIALRGPETETANRIAAWDVINNAINEALDVDNTPQQQLNHRLLVKFTTLVMETDFGISQSKFTGKNQAQQKQRTMWVQVMWPQGSVGKVNTAIKQLFRHLVLSSKCEAGYPKELLKLLQSMTAMTAHCCHLGNSGEPIDYNSAQCHIMARELTYLIKGEVRYSPESLHNLLTSFKLPWLRMLVTRMLLDLYDDSLLLTVNVDVNQLCLRKIVARYFYLLPPVLSQLTTQHKVARTEPRRVPRKLPLTPISFGSSQDNIQPKASPKTNAITARKAANINKKNFKGETALHRACMKNNVIRIRELLLVPGIDVNVQDHAGWTPIHETCNRGSVDCLMELLNYTPAKSIDSYFNQESSQRLKRVDVTAANADGITPLHDAVNNNQVDVARLLLQHGGRGLLKAKTADGFTPVDMAVTDEMREGLTASSSTSSSALSSPHKRLSIATNIDDSQNTSLSQDSFAQSPETEINMPTDESYKEVLSIATASPEHCLTLIVLLRHLVSSYMTVHQIHKLKTQITDPSRKCPLAEKDCLRKDCAKSSHVTCLCAKLEESFRGGVEGIDLKDDVCVLRQWKRHHANLKNHLDRISSGKITVVNQQLQIHLMAIYLLGSIK